jgi:hypothetical protein
LTVPIAEPSANSGVVLLGDPQQLSQVKKGAHPEGVDVSSLEHVLGGLNVIDPTRGIFLAETWRLHPDVNAFTSELFYEGKLTAEAGCSNQITTSSGPFSGTGLRYVPVMHSGNQSSSIEEADAVAVIVDRLLNTGMQWTDRDGEAHVRQQDDDLPQSRSADRYLLNVARTGAPARAVSQLARGSRAAAPRRSRREAPLIVEGV